MGQDCQWDLAVAPLCRVFTLLPFLDLTGTGVPKLHSEGLRQARAFLCFINRFVKQWFQLLQSLDIVVFCI